MVNNLNSLLFPKAPLRHILEMEQWMLKYMLVFFLNICDFHLVEHDHVIVRIFIQTLLGKAYECYTTFTSISIGSFDDLKAMFLNMFSPPVTYHTLLTNFTQICLKKNDRIRDIDLIFYKILNKIHEDKTPNNLVILGSYKNSMPPNVNFSIRDSQIDTLKEAMIKATKMEENMIETNVDPNIILRRMQGKIDNLNINDQ